MELTTASGGGPNGGPAGGTAGPDSRIIRLKLTVTEVGSDVGGGGGVQLPGLQRRHCVLAHTGTRLGSIGIAPTGWYIFSSLCGGL